MKQFLLIGLMLWLLSGTVFAQESGLPELDPLESSSENNLPEPLMRLGYGYPGEIKWLPDGKTFAVGSSIGVWFYQADNLEAEPRFISTTPEDGYNFTFSSDGRMMATGHVMIRLWDVASGELLKVIETDEEVSTLVFSHDNRLVAATMAFFTSRGVRIWDASTGQLLKTFRTNDHFTEIAFTADDRSLIGSWSDCCEQIGYQIIRWNIETEAETVLQEEAARFVLSPDTSEMIYETTTGDLIVRSLDDESSPIKLELPEPNTQYQDIRIFWTNDTRLLIYKDATLYWVERNRLEILKTKHIDVQNLSNDIAVTHDGKQLAIRQGDSLYLIDTNTGETIGQHLIRMMGAAVLSPDGTLLATLTNNNEIWIWDIESLKPLYVLNKEGLKIGLIVFGDNNTLLFTDDQQTIHIWNIAGQMEKAVIKTGDYIGALFSDGKEILVLSEFKAHLYDVATALPKPFCTNPETQQPITELTNYFGYETEFDYDGHTLITISENIFFLWDRETCAEAFTRIEIIRIDTGYSDIQLANGLVFTASSRSVVEAWRLPDISDHWIVTPHNKPVDTLVVDRNNTSVVISGSCIYFIPNGYGADCLGTELRLSRSDIPFPLIFDNAQHTINEIQLSLKKRIFVTVGDGIVVIWGNPAR